MRWNQIVERVKPYLVKVETPAVSGTGFLCFYNDNKQWCGIATALHVVEYADDWQQPIKILRDPKKSTDQIFLKEGSRIVFADKETDEVGWIGFPYIEPYTACFFSGCISARREDRKAYLIDGVSINGVSGGPVFYPAETGGIKIVGIVSAYQANRAAGAALPGLLIAQDVSHFHDVIKHIKSIDEARKKKQELKAEEKVKKLGAESGDTRAESAPA